MRKIKQQSVVKNLRVGEIKIRTKRERERERERERHKGYISIQEMQQLQLTTKTTTTTTPFIKGYKVTLYNDSLRATSLYAIYINSLS